MLTLYNDEVLEWLFDLHGANKERLRIPDSLAKRFNALTTLEGNDPIPIFRIEYDAADACFYLWRSDLFVKSSENAVRQKAYNDRQRDLRLVKDDARQRVVKQIASFGLDNSTARLIADKLIKQRDTGKLASFGIDITHEEWKDLYAEA